MAISWLFPLEGWGSLAMTLWNLLVNLFYIYIYIYISHMSFMFPEYSINVLGLSKCLPALVTALIKGNHHFCHITGMQFTDQKLSEEFRCSSLR